MLWSFHFATIFSQADTNIFFRIIASERFHISEVFLLRCTEVQIALSTATHSLASQKDCYVVEDAYAGIDAAKAAGMKAIGIGDAASYEKADYKIEQFDELQTLI